MTAAGFLLVVAAAWAVGDLRNRLRDRATAAVERRRGQMHGIRVRYGRPRLGRRVR